MAPAMLVGAALVVTCSGADEVGVPVGEPAEPDVCVRVPVIGIVPVTVAVPLLTAEEAADETGGTTGAVVAGVDAAGAELATGGTIGAVLLRDGMMATEEGAGTGTMGALEVAGAELAGAELAATDEVEETERVAVVPMDRVTEVVDGTGAGGGLTGF